MSCMTRDGGGEGEAGSRGTARRKDRGGPQKHYKQVHNMWTGDGSVEISV